MCLAARCRQCRRLALNQTDPCWPLTCAAALLPAPSLGASAESGEPPCGFAETRTGRGERRESESEMRHRETWRRRAIGAVSLLWLHHFGRVDAWSTPAPPNASPEFLASFTLSKPTRFYKEGRETEVACYLANGCKRGGAEARRKIES